MKVPLDEEIENKVGPTHLDSKAKIKVIGLVKNGNTSKFKPIQLDGENYVILNTCAFDSVTQILVVAYCDSNDYASFVIKRKNESTLWHLVFALLRDGVTIQTYKKRANILKQLYPGEPTTNGTTILSVEQPVDNMLMKLLQNDESVEIVEKCTSCDHEKIMKKPYLTVCVSVKNPTEKQIYKILNLEINNLFNYVRCKFCSKLFNLIPKFGYHIFFNIINLNKSMNAQFTDTNLQLKYIPKCLTVSGTEYYFRGSVTTPDCQKQATSYDMVGHYHAHTYRHPINVWQMYDDTKEKVYTISDREKVNVQILMFSR